MLRHLSFAAAILLAALPALAQDAEPAPAAAAAADPAATAESTAVHLFRPATVGMRTRVRATASQKGSLVRSAHGQVLSREDESISARLSGVYEVTAVDEAGVPTTLTLTVDSLHAALDGDKERPVLQEGRVITVSREEWGFSFLKDGEPVAMQLGRILELIAGSPYPGPSDGQLFDSPEPRGAGDSWQIEPESAATIFAARGVMAPAENYSGSVTLDSFVDVGEQRCMLLKGQVKATGVRLDVIPAAFKLVSGEFSHSVSSHLPLDPDAQAMSLNQHLTLHLVNTGVPAGSDAVIKIESRQETTRDLSLIPLP